MVSFFYCLLTVYYIALCVAQRVDLDGGGFEVRDRVAMRAVVDEAILHKELLLVFTSQGEAIDNYTELYIGWLQYLFTSDRFKLKLVLLVVDVTRPRADYTADVDYFLGILPEESVFVVFDHNPTEMDLRSMGYVTQAKTQAVPRTNDTVVLRYYHPVRDFSIFHVNHEQPWNFQVGAMNVNYFSEEMLWDLTTAHKLVFRNYFHGPLERAPGVVQLPLGPAYFGFKGPYFGPNSTLPTAVPVSRRPIPCRFIGRHWYGPQNKSVVPGRAHLFAIARRLPFAEVLSVNSTHVIGLRGFFAEGLSQTTGSAGVSERPVSDTELPCEVVDSFEYSRLPGYLEAYTSSLAQTRFVPCPPGNNPETFRHYEALEAGCIPLILTSTPHSDFLQSEYWRDYPGPLFSTWTEAAAFVRNSSDR